MIVEFEKAVQNVPAVDWDRCAGQSNPFVSHAFLSALESCRCVGRQTGWLPFPGVLRESTGGRILAVCPSYIKLNSKGEYMFDYHWAEAYHRMGPPGSSYYPKLQVAVPFTPVPGPRLLVDESLEPSLQESARVALLSALKGISQKLEFSSVHITFCEPEEGSLAQSQSDFLGRVGEQYHWFNDEYETFDDFLKSLTSRKRKNIRRERAKAQAHPLNIRTIHGDEVSPQQLERFFRMYQTTSLSKWGQPYLNLDFFRTLAKTLGNKLVLFLVQSQADQQWVAGAWNLRGSNTLFGRNWGCLQHFDCLHFEVCYYRAIEYAIEHRLEKVEAGAQGMHKIQRGYRPRPVHSVHHIESESFRAAIADYLESERLDIEHRIEALKRLEPFKQSSQAGS